MPLFGEMNLPLHPLPAVYCLLSTVYCLLPSVGRRHTAYSILSTVSCLPLSMGCADPLNRAAVFLVSQRALASETNVHKVITAVKNKMRLYISGADLFGRRYRPLRGPSGPADCGPRQQPHRR
jgi:hypothetical protein